MAKFTPKVQDAPWETRTIGEAGNFIELRSRGGIVGYSKSETKGEL